MTHKHEHNGAPSGAVVGDNEPMGESRYENGKDHYPDRIEKRKIIGASLEFISSNWPVIRNVVAALAVGGAGVATLLPVRHYEFDQFKTEITAKVDSHSTAINEIKGDVKQIKSTTDAILLKLTPAAQGQVQLAIRKVGRKAHVKPNSGFHTRRGRR